MRHPFLFFQKKPKKVFNYIFPRNSEKHDFCLSKINSVIRLLAHLKGLCIAKVESSSSANLKNVMEKI